jgi:predicted Zn-dependent protease
MTTDDNDADDEAAFSEALRQRDQGNISAAIKLLAKLAAKQQNKASVVGMLAGLQLDIGDFAGSASNARRAVNLAPKSDLASRILFHALFGLNQVDEAFREVKRFRAIKHSVEYDRILAELENDTLRDLLITPNDAFLRRLLDAVRDELRARPIKQ